MLKKFIMIEEEMAILAFHDWTLTLADFDNVHVCVCVCNSRSRFTPVTLIAKKKVACDTKVSSSMTSGRLVYARKKKKETRSS